MGFAVGYITTETLTPDQQSAIQQSLSTLTTGRTWLSCEPPLLTNVDGQLRGSSKPNFSPHPDDVASAESENLPDGTLNDLLDALCAVSKDHKIDWEISHDHSGGPIGYIRQGTCDETVREQCASFSEIGDIIGDLGLDLDL